MFKINLHLNYGRKQSTVVYCILTFQSGDAISSAVQHMTSRAIPLPYVRQGVAVSSTC
jgi:hypothetical protein